MLVRLFGTHNDDSGQHNIFGTCCGTPHRTHTHTFDDTHKAIICSMRPDPRYTQTQASIEHELDNKYVRALRSVDEKPQIPSYYTL